MNPDSQNPTNEPEETTNTSGDMPQAPATPPVDDGQGDLPTEGATGENAPEVPAPGSDQDADDEENPSTPPVPSEGDKEDGAKW